MKKNLLLVISVNIIVLFTYCQPATDMFPGVRNDYFGLKPPGTKPKVFLPGIISTNEYFEYSNTISPDGREFYFARRIDKKDIQMVVRWENDVLTLPEPAAFLNTQGGFEPHISPDGLKIYFTRIAPPPSGLAIDKSLSPRDMEAQMVNIWVMEKHEPGDESFIVFDSKRSEKSRGFRFICLFLHQRWDME